MWPDCSPPRLYPFWRICSTTYLSPTGPEQGGSESAQRHFKSQVAHNRGDNRIVFQGISLDVVLGADSQNLIAVKHFAFLIGHNDPVRIPIQRKTCIGPGLTHHCRHIGGIKSAAILIDILTIRFVTHHDDFRSEFFEDGGGNAVRRSIRAVDYQFDPFECEFTRKCCLEVDNIAPLGIIYPPRPADFGRRGLRQAFDFSAQDEIFHELFGIVWQFEAVAPEDLYPVVFKLIMGCRYDYACIGAHAARDIGNSGSGKRTDQENVDPHGTNTGGNRGFDHISGESRVLSDYDLGPAVLVFEEKRRAEAHLHSEVRRHRKLICHAANSVRPKKLSHQSSSMAGQRKCSTR